MSIIKNFTARFFGRKENFAFDASYNLQLPVIDYHWKLSNCAAVADAVDRVASAIANTNPQSMLNDKIIETLATKLINNPNDKSSGDKMLYKIVEDIYKMSKSYVVIVGLVTGKPLELYHVEGIKVSEFEDTNGNIDYVTINNDDFAGTYKFDDKNRLVTADNLKQLIIIEYPSESSFLKSLTIEIATLMDGLKRNTALMQNGGRMTTLITYKDNPSQDQMEQRTTSIQNQIRGKQYGGMLSTTGETETKEMGLTPRDMDFAVLQAECKNQVYLNCGIPLAMVSQAASTYNNVETAQESFYTETVIPLANLIYTTIGMTIAKREGQPYTTLTNTQEIAVIQKMLTKAAKDRKELGAETVNETRRSLGLESYPNGDVLLVESRYVPLESLGVEI